MQEQRYQSTEPSNGGGLAKFLLGLFTGVAVAAPITALITSKICDGQKKEAVEKASIEAENRGIQAATAEAQEWITNNLGSGARAVFEANRGISEGVNGVAEASAVNDGVNEKPDWDATVAQALFVQVEDGRFKKVEPAANNAREAYLASMQSPPEDTPGDFDLENYDLRIDDEEATEDAQAFSEQHVQYLDMVERYKNSGGDIPPMTISREQFENEHIFEKCYVNWYDEDDVFEENDTRIDDPGYLFGFSSGRDMFAEWRTAQREDPDLCHIRNAKTSTDFEITRMRGSYAKLVVDGEVYYNGEANSQL